MENENKTEQRQEVTSEYVPVKPVDPNDYSVQQYLYDTNTLLTQIDNDLKLIVQILAQKEQQSEKPRPRTIGIRHD